MSILIIISLIILVLLTYIIITLFHELSHKKKLNKHGLKCEIKWNLYGIKLFKNFALAVCTFDEIKFNKLKNSVKKEILLSGINVELFFVFLFLIFSVISWIFIKGSFIFYYTSIFFITLLGRIFLNFIGKESDGEKLRKLNRMEGRK